MIRHQAFGFTLTEVLIALGIVAFGLLSLLTLLPVGLRSTGLAGDITTAAFLAEQELGKYRANAAVRDFIDSNLDNTLDATDFNGVQDAGEPYESGWLLSEFADIGKVSTATAVASGMAFPPEYALSNVGTGTFVVAANQIGGLGAATPYYAVHLPQTAAAAGATLVTDVFTFRAVTAGPSATFSVSGLASGRLANATSGAAYNPASAELTRVWIPDGTAAGDGQDAVNGRSWAPGDRITIRTCTECRDGDGLGYWDLPPSRKKGRLKDVRVNTVDAMTPPIAQTWTIRCTTAGVTGGAAAVFSVTGSVSGPAQNATAGSTYTAVTTDPLDGESITFTITENDSRIYDGENAYNAEWQVGDTLEITVVVVENAWYALYAQRMDVGEDRLFPGINLAGDGIDNDVDGTTDEANEADYDGVLTRLTAAGYRPEDTGLDLVPSFIDEDRDGTADATEPAGEAGFNRVTNPDPHGDEGITENNRRTIAPFPADRFSEHEMQKVTVTVVWREGGRDRKEQFSTVIANPFP